MIAPPYRGRTALITGASSGIGAAYARHVAARGYDLIVVARRVERLEALATELQQRHGIRVDVLQADLTDPEAVARVADEIGRCETLALLVNNAGFGTEGTFAATPVALHRQMIQVHLTASVQLTHAALPGMVARQRGAIINVASVAAFAPVAGSVTYGASKAFLCSFCQALDQELQGTGVSIQALCPGFTRTEFHDTINFVGFRNLPLPNFLWMSADAVVATSLQALPTKQVVVVPGWINQAVILLARSALLRGVAGRIFLKALWGNGGGGGRK